MDDENLLGCEQDELKFLLNYSRISQNKQENPWFQFQMSRDKLNLTEKERTRQESYQEIMKKIHHVKLQGKELTNQLQTLKHQICARYLTNFQQELDELNSQNARLRKQLQNSERRKEEERSERHSTRSPIKPRTSIKSSYANENKKTSTKGQNRASPNMLLKKEIKMTESTSNLGRSQIQSPKHHKKRESQLTERKIEDHKVMRTEMSFSMLDDQVEDFQIKQSVSVRNLASQETSEQNVFVRILKDILEEERQYEEEKFGELSGIQPHSGNNMDEQVHFINQIESQIQKTNQKIDMLDLILSNFQEEISQLNVNLRVTGELTQKLWEVKGRYVEMERRCGSLVSLRKEVKEKEERLQLLSLREGREKQKPISSIETMVRLLSNQSKTFSHSSTKLYMEYCRQIKSLFKFEKEEEGRRTIRMARVKETIDGIREGRKKFNELIHIYEARICKLQEKIEQVRVRNQRWGC